MRVEEFMSASAARFPSKTALVVGETRLSFAELDALANQCGRALRRRGVQRGDRVVVFCDNSVEAVVGIFGAMKAGAVFSPVNPTTKADKLAFILNNCRASAIVTQQKQIDTVGEAVAHAPTVHGILVAGGVTALPAITQDQGSHGCVSGLTRQCSPPPNLPQGGGAGSFSSPLGEVGRGFGGLPVNIFAPVAGDDAAVTKSVCGGLPMFPALAAEEQTPPDDPGIDIDLAMVIYTSGSTGFPKGVMMTHQNIVHAATSITTYLENTPDDIVLSVVPISFDYGLYQLLMSVKIGMTLVLEKSFAFPQAVLNRLAAEKATGFPLVPTIAALVLQNQTIKPGMFPHLRYITNTAAALPPAHILRLAEMFPTTRIYSMYGVTECKRCTYLPPEQLRQRTGSVGKAIPNSEAWIVDEKGLPVGPGVVGELVIRGGHVMKGYWENPEATDKALRPGVLPCEKVLYTGDLFRMDDEGYLYFVARKDDIIKTRGEKVSPKEVENVIYQIPGVAEVAVVGVPDAILGMAIKAVVVLVAGAELGEREIIRHCAANLEDFMVPKSVEFRRELPMTGSGKIRRSEVQAEELGTTMTLAN